MNFTSRPLLFFTLAIPVVVALVSLLTISIIISTSRSHIYERIADVPKAEAALILGAGVLRSGNLSSVLKDRVDEALDLYEAEKVEKIIASGNRSADYNEVDPIVTYLINHSVPESDILIDYAGFDTYSSIYRARHVFGMSSITIVSQSFHLPRAIFIARNLNLTANGISADRGHYKLTNYFREMFADVKAVVNLLLHRRPASAQTIQADSELQEGYLFPVW
jgi:SanA protein